MLYLLLLERRILLVREDKSIGEVNFFGYCGHLLAYCISPG
jgi:hypothetical protein